MAHEIELRVHRYSEARSELHPARKRLSTDTFLFGLEQFVVGLDDRLLAGKIVVRRALHHLRPACNLLHGGGIEALLSK